MVSPFFNSTNICWFLALVNKYSGNMVVLYDDLLERVQNIKGLNFDGRKNFLWKYWAAHDFLMIQVNDK